LASGPFVYCLEAHDLGAAPQHFSVDTAAVIDEDHSAFERARTSLEVQGVLRTTKEGPLYRPRQGLRSIERSARFVPYFSWANRGPNAMQVWLDQIS
jgi:DUF1680 family protein